MLNDLVERYIMHRNWQWHHDKTVWPAWAKQLETHELRALNSYRVTILSTLQRRLRLFLAAPVNVRFAFPSNMRVACSPYDFAILMTQQVLEERGSETRNVTSVFQNVQATGKLSPQTNSILSISGCSQCQPSAAAASRHWSKFTKVVVRGGHFFNEISKVYRQFFITF